jgi:uroporphyrinogen-III synthase
VIYPGLAFAPPADFDSVDAALKAVSAGQYDAVILTSAYAAAVISERLKTLKLSWAERIIWTIGSYTASNCRFEAAIQTPPPQVRDALTLLQVLPDMQGKRILLPQSPLAAPILAQGLIERGAHVTIVHPYMVIPSEEGKEVPDLFHQNVIRAMTFFSGSAVDGVVTRLEASGVSIATIRSIPAVCFGGSTAWTARHHALSIFEGDSTYEKFYALLEWACQP